MLLVPSSLRKWFVFHFFANSIAGIQLLLVPAWFLERLGFEQIDPVTARLVGAALLGIAIASLLVKNKGVAEYRTLLLVKAIWSGLAIVGFILSIVQYGKSLPNTIWFLLAVFVAFHSLWNYYLYKLK